MATSKMVDNTVSQGVAGLKKKMKELKERIAVENGKAEVAEAENLRQMEHLFEQVGRYNSMKSRCEDLTEDIEKYEKKVRLFLFLFILSTWLFSARFVSFGYLVFISPFFISFLIFAPTICCIRAS